MRYTEARRSHVFGAAALALMVAALLSFGWSTAKADDEPQEDDFPKSARLSSTRIKALPRHAFELPKSAKLTDTPTAVTATVAQAKVVFIDVDGNGRYDDLGVDGWKPNSKDFVYMLPVESWIAIAGGLRKSDGEPLHFR